MQEAARRSRSALHIHVLVCICSNVRQFKDPKSVPLAICTVSDSQCRRGGGGMRPWPPVMQFLGFYMRTGAGAGAGAAPGTKGAAQTLGRSKHCIMPATHGGHACMMDIFVVGHRRQNLLSGAFGANVACQMSAFCQPSTPKFAWLADMQCRQGCHRATPRRPVSL